MRGDREAWTQCQHLLPVAVLRVKDESEWFNPLDGLHGLLSELHLNLDHHSLVTAMLIKYYGNGGEQGVNRPLDTVTTKDRFALVTIHGVPHRIVDIGMRMLSPRELARAQGFPDDYSLDATSLGEAVTKTAQTRMIGNSVCPPVARALVEANLADLTARRQAA